MIKSVNNDFEYTILDKEIDKFYLWNLKNNNICIKVDDNNYLFNYNGIKLIFSYDIKKLNITYYHKKKLNKLNQIIDKINANIKKSKESDLTSLLGKIHSQFKKIFKKNLDNKLIYKLIDNYSSKILLNSKIIF